MIAASLLVSGWFLALASGVVALCARRGCPGFLRVLGIAGQLVALGLIVAGMARALA